MARPRKTELNGNNFKQCIGQCKKRLNITNNFYNSDSAMFPDGKVPICKSCIKKDIDTGGMEAVHRILRQIDKPFIVSEWNKSVASGKEPFGWYLRQINSLHQYVGKGYADSVGDEDEAKDIRTGYKPDVEDEDSLYDPPTIDVKRKWGLGYSNKEYYELEKTWDEMITSNQIETPQHRTNLELYCQLKVKTKRALANDDIKTFDMLNKQFAEVQKNSGFRPIDRISGNESAGIRSFSVIFEEIERDGWIEPYPIEFHQDIVDRTIMYLANYTRKLLQMEQLITPPDDTPKVDMDGDM